MTPERHRQIGQIYHDALELEPDERAAFLDRTCAGDAALRDEVASLIASHQHAEGFIEAPALDVAAELLAENLDKELAPTQVLVDQPTAKPIFFWIALLLGAIVLSLYVFAGLMVFQYGNLKKDLGWKYTSRGRGVYVSDVDPAGIAAGRLRAGDQILALNNEAHVSFVAPSYMLRGIPAESVYTIRVRRGGTEFQFELSLPPLTNDSSYFGPALSRLAVSIGFFFLAMLIGLQRPGERVAQLACIGSLAGAMMELETVLRPKIDLFQGVEILTYGFLIVPFMFFSPAIAYHFFYRFPPGVPEGRNSSFFKHFFYWWGATLCFMVVSLRLVHFIGNPALIAVLFSPYFYLKVFPAVRSLFFLFVTLAVCAVIVRNYRLIKEPDQHRRMKWVIYGSVIGVVPTISTSLALFILFATDQGGAHGYLQLSSVFRLMDLFADAALIVIPITFSYAIIKHKIFDINVVVRRGLQYALAKNVLRIVLALPVIGLAYQTVSNPDKTISDVVLNNPIYLFLAAAAALSLKFRRRLTEWIDRRFFREAYDQEQILIGLIDEIKGLSSMADISKLVSRKLDSALHLTRIYVFHTEAGRRDLTLGYSSWGSLPNLTIPMESQLFRFMADEHSAQQSPFSLRQPLPPDEQAWLDQLGINLIVRMSGTDGQLIGLLLLGEKKSEEPYTANDCRLLEAIARQIAMVYENILLKQHVDKEGRIKREVLSRLEEQQINLVKECPECGACYDSAAQACVRDGGELTLTLPVERTIEGKYRLDQLLGKGGMGAVYQATDLRLDRQVAIKIIIGNLFGDQAALRRFEREARASAKLNHPNIVAIYDYGRTAAEGTYLVMELVPGITLREEIKRAGCLSPQVSADWLDQLLEAVKAAHEAGVIHRDLKPENILISAREDSRTIIKIVDFGLAKLRLLDAADPNSLTAPGTVMGTINYMSPEQLSGEEVDERSDIFSLGVMVVESLTGSRPFTGRTYTEVLTSILHRSYHFRGTEKEAVRLDRVLQKCLAKDREQRYRTVSELQQELIPAIDAYSRSTASEVPHDQDQSVHFPSQKRG